MLRTIPNVPKEQAVARIIPEGYGECAWIFTGGPGTAPYVTTLGVALVGIDPDDYVQACDDLFAQYRSVILPLTSDALTLDRVVLSIGLAGGTSGSVSSTNSAAQGGISGVEFAPLAMSAIATKQSASLGRKGRGRSFLPGTVRDASVDEGGNLTSGAVAAIGDAWSALLVNLATATPGRAMSPVILHADGSTPSVIVSGGCSPKVGWIRGRIR